MVRVIAIDLDTALLGVDGRVASDDARAIAAAIDGGVRVVLVTARVVESARRTLPWDVPLIAAEGAQISLSGRSVLAQHALPGSRASATIAALASRGLAVAALAPDGLVGERACAAFADALVPGSSTRYRAGDVPARSVLALFGAGARERVVEVARELSDPTRRALVRVDVLTLPDGLAAVRIRGAHASRARALRVLTSRWDLRRPVCAYVGPASASDPDAIAWAGRALTISATAGPGRAACVADAIAHLLARGSTPTEIESEVSVQRATCHQPLGR